MLNAALVQTSSPLPGSLHERLSQLGLTALILSSNGQAQALAEPTWFEARLIASPSFAQAVTSRWASLQTAAGQAVELFPGARLAVLAGPRRRRLPRAVNDHRLIAVLLLDPQLLHSEQLHHICQFHQLDITATRTRIDTGRLMAAPQAGWLAAALNWMNQDAAQVDRHLHELQHIGQELADSYEELSLLYKLSARMTVNESPVGFFTDACEELQQVVGLRWMAMQLSSQEPRLEDLAGRNFVAGPVERSAELKQIGLTLLDRFGSRPEPTIIDDTRELNIPSLPSLATSLMVIPLYLKDKSVAILFGGDKIDGSQIDSVDSKLCDSLGSSLTIFLDNMMLYQDMHAMFLGTLHALTSAIDAKDSYTHGHSERVALMSRMLAEAAGLDDHTCQRVYVAGLVHDVGKIGVPEAVLCKPGKLTDEEFAMIKRHPEIGARILQGIRQMKDLVPGVLCHHERWDGRGYPQNLTGENIPLFGRLIGLADAFDAMSSNRTYRRALLHRQVLDEITACAGKQFDPELAPIFVNLDFQPFHDLIEEHHAQTRRSA